MDLTSLNKDRKRRKTSIDMSTMVYGKVPPQAKELEEAVLGAIMLEKGALELVSEILTAESFYVEANQMIFKVFEELSHRHDPIDILTVVEELKFREQLDAVGGPYYVTKLTNAVVSTANIEAHARIVFQKFAARELIRVGGEIIGNAYEDSTDIFDLKDSSERDLSNIASRVVKTNTIQDDVHAFVISMDTRIHKAKHGQIQGITSGFPDMDRETFGWQPGDLITLGAMPSVGKTCLALNLARNAAIAGHGSAFFSREMKGAKLMDRLISMESGVPMRFIKSGQIDAGMREHIMKAIKRIETWKLFLISASGMTWLEERNYLRKLKRKYGVVQCIDDYVQLSKDVDAKGKNKEQIISTITSENKRTAQDLDVAFIQLSQVLGKEISKRDVKVPTMQDVRESEAISNDSDIVGMIYRPEYHEIFTTENGENTFGKAKVKWVKMRDGDRNVETDLKCDMSIQRFYGMNESEITKYGGQQSIVFDAAKKNEQFDEGFKEEPLNNFK